MKKKRQESNKTNSISHNIMQNNNFPIIEDENIIKEKIMNEEIMNDLNENSQLTTNTSISNDSYVFRKRESSSSSSLASTKKMKTS